MTDLHRAVLRRFANRDGHGLPFVASRKLMNTAEIAKDLSYPESKIATILAEALAYTRAARLRA
jgi:hypothetical protein